VEGRECNCEVGMIVMDNMIMRSFCVLGAEREHHAMSLEQARRRRIFPIVIPWSDHFLSVIFYISFCIHILAFIPNLFYRIDLRLIGYRHQLRGVGLSFIASEYARCCTVGTLSHTERDQTPSE